MASRDSLERGLQQARLVAGVIATGLLLGAAATMMLRAAGDVLEPGDASAAATAAPKPATAKDVPAGAVVQKPLTVKPAAPPVAARPGAAPAAAQKPPVQVASSSPRVTVAPASAVPAVKMNAKPAVRPSTVQPVANLDDQITYQYNALGRRDPFMPMIGGEFVGGELSGDGPVDVGGMTVVGIVWGSTDRFALIEDGKGNSQVLRVGDKVMNGVVEELRRDAVVVRLTVDGQSQSVAIPLTRKGDRSDAKH